MSWSAFFFAHARPGDMFGAVMCTWILPNTEYYLVLLNLRLIEHGTKSAPCSILQCLAQLLQPVLSTGVCYYEPAGKSSITVPCIPTTVLLLALLGITAFFLDRVRQTSRSQTGHHKEPSLAQIVPTKPAKLQALEKASSCVREARR